MNRILAALMLAVTPACTSAGPIVRAAGPSLPTVAARTAGLEHRPGLLDLYVDRAHGRVLLAVPSPGERGVAGSYLYVEGLVDGLGSNPVGLDRGQMGPTLVVDVRQVGNRVLIEAENLSFRADTPDEPERRAVRESFASSVLWAGEIVALDPDGRSAVDLTGFLLRDAHGVVARLAAEGQGKFTLDKDRSAVDLDAVLAFPDNLEFESILTFSSPKPGPEVRATTPVPDAVTLTVRQSLIRLPAPGFHPRPFDPRCGSIPIEFTDYAVPLGQPTKVQWIERYRLEKIHPEAPSSPVVKPIVYYLDPGVPEPVRSALLDGARWWAQAFAKAGFENAYRVEMLPPGASPLDVRYNVIEWVHRATRGWSYGGAVVDPRTGEIVKGHVLLGSQRVRQDILIFQALLGADGTGSGRADDPIQLALARLRQLAAHEVGHTLGLAHNFAASTIGRASVMDYPAPLVRRTAEGPLDVSEAYGTGIGAWDEFAIRYAYEQFPPGADQTSELASLVRGSLDSGLIFLTDQDARPAGAANPLASLWDNGSDPVAELASVMAVRRTALDRFSAANVAPGRPLAQLQETLAPLYFFQRYQLAAAVKVIGGVEYRNALRGDGQPPATPCAPAWQRRALDAVLATLAPPELDLPDSIVALLLPRPAESGPNPEMFRGHTDPTFDPLAAAATAAGMTVDALLEPHRLARIVDQHRRDPSLPGPDEVATALLDRVFAVPSDESPRLAAIRRAERWVVADRLVTLTNDPDASAAVRAIGEETLRAIADRTASAGGEDLVLHEAVRRFLERRTWQAAPLPAPLEPPPGDPIGDDGGAW